MNLFKKLFTKEQKKIIIKQEIDYDKLAQAIVDAQKKLKEEENKANENELIVTKSLFITIPFILLLIFSIFSYIFSLAILWVVFYNFNGFTKDFWLCIFIVFFSLFLTFISGSAAYEIYNLKDFDKIIAITSSFTSIVAAIIALVTLIISLKVS